MRFLLSRGQFDIEAIEKKYKSHDGSLCSPPILPNPLSASTPQLSSKLLDTSRSIYRPDIELKMAISPITTQFQTLKDTLSKAASISLPTDSDFPAVSQRWSDFNKPTPGAIINVTCEEDISNTVTPSFLCHPATAQYR